MPGACQILASSFPGAFAFHNVQRSVVSGQPSTVVERLRQVGDEVIGVFQAYGQP